MITAKQLRELLETIPDDTPIVMQKDDEGNGYRFMNGIDFEAEGDQANLYNADEGGCIRASDIDDGDFLTDDYSMLVAVAY